MRETLMQATEESRLRPERFEVKTRLNLNDLLKKRTEENKIDKKNNWLIFSGTAAVASVVVLILSL
tara:strand:- start:358 stop:555 length:198 start_codon:yes stop_codon:yes gene_type:complete